MTKIFIHITFIFALVLVSDRVFTLLFMPIFNRTISGQSGGSINYVIQHPHEYNVLILGSSRAKNSIDPAALSFLGKGYNLGINGSKPLNALLVLDVLLSHHVDPQTLIVQADLFELGPDQKDDTIEQLKRMYPYDTPLVRSYVNTMGPAEIFKYSFGLYRFNRKILNITYNFLKRNSQGEETGFVGLPSSPEKLDTTPQFANYQYDPSSLNAQALLKIKELADAHHIRLIVVFPPTYQNVGYNSTEQKRLREDLFAHGITEVIDLSTVDATPSLKNEENWRDSFHLSAAGAERFSKILASLIKP